MSDADRAIWRLDLRPFVGSCTAIDIEPEMLRAAQAAGLSFSVTAPAMSGERRAEFEAELQAVLEPFAANGVVEEEVVAKATVFG